MISKNVAKAINRQVNAELCAAYLYMAMSAYVQSLGLSGAARWLYHQACEEMTHAQRLYRFMVRVGERVTFDAIDRPLSDFQSLQQVFEEALKHERRISSMINDLINLAIQEKDHASEIQMQWFVSEQVEEERAVADILARLKLAGEHPGGLLMIDRELGARTFTMPADLAVE